MQVLRELIALGFEPWMALLVAAVVAVWGALIVVCGVVVFLYKRLQASRDSYHADTREQLQEAKSQASAALSGLEASERRHDVCDTDRKKMKRQIGGLQTQVRMLHACPHEVCPLKVMLEKMKEE